MASGRREIHGLAAVAMLAVAALIVAFALAGADRASAGTMCEDADATETEATEKELQKALVCLIAEERKARDKHRLDPNGKLNDVAAKHNRRMVEENCWKHRCAGEPGLSRRLKRSGYLDGAERWSYGQNFGCGATPQAVMNAWMNNEFTRRNIRDGGFRDIGADAIKDQVGHSACDDGDEVTYTVLFARRKG